MMSKSVDDSRNKRDDFRRCLAQDTASEMPAPNWSAIEASLSQTASNNAKDESVVYLGLKRKVKRLQWALGAAAAALFIVVLIPFSTVDVENESAVSETTLLLLIDENRVLQDRLDAMDGQPFSQYVVQKTAISQLDEIDFDIQQAYLDNASVEQKITLWQRRKQLLLDTYEATMETNSKPPGVVVI